MGLVTDRDSLQEWVATAVGAGAGRSDAALLVAAWRAAPADARAALDEVVALAAAWRGTAEPALDSRAQGAGFLATTRAAWPHVLLDALALRHRGELALPVAVGVAAAAQEVPLPAVLTAYLHGFAGNLVSAGRRAVPPVASARGRALLARRPGGAGAAGGPAGRPPRVGRRGRPRLRACAGRSAHVA